MDTGTFGASCIKKRYQQSILKSYYRYTFIMLEHVTSLPIASVNRNEELACGDSELDKEYKVEIQGSLLYLLESAVDQLVSMYGYSIKEMLQIISLWIRDSYNILGK